MTYAAPLRDFRFLLNDVLKVDQYAQLPGFADCPPEVTEQILEEGAKFCAGVLAPLNAVGDHQGCTRHPDGRVTTPTGFKAAYQQFVDNGWPGMGCDPAFGGQGLPHVINTMVSEMLCSANMAWAMYPGLSHGAYSALLHHGSDTLKATYLPKLVSGAWTGTMNLTEPHCGTDLGLLRTKAEPLADGAYKITGQKIFISAGDHDMAENIIHLVLARIDGAPAGVKGISLFVVPKFLVNPDGSLGAANPLSCGKLEEKMGIHGNATCVMNFDGALGWLVGDMHRGLPAMFTMMNEARLGVALQGLSQSEAAYQHAAIYAKDRLQGRSLTGAKNADGPADPIIVHPDVRRMLLDARCFNEGARAFAYWTALYGDLADKTSDEALKTKANDYMALMTPVLKAFLTERGFTAAVDCQQVYGGHGYIEEWGMSQFVRDARIAMIYEGANGIQALDLVGRKLPANAGRAVFTFFGELDQFLGENKDDPALKPFLDGLTIAKGHLQEGSMWLMEHGQSNFDNAGAASMDYLRLFGVTGLSYMWALMAKAALAAKAAGSTDPYYDTKLKTGRYFLDRMLPETGLYLARMKAGASAVMAFTEVEF